MNLPRVTYSNTGEDFSGVHACLDEILPDAEARLLGNIRPSFIGGEDRPEGRNVSVRSPIDYGIILGEFPQADENMVNDAVHGSAYSSMPTIAGDEAGRGASRSFELRRT